MSLGALGLLFGLALALAAKRFYVKVDPRIEEINRLLPGANCGACGYAGCAALAESLVEKGVCVGACPVCENEEREKIASVLDVKLEEQTRKRIFLLCDGAPGVERSFIYDGIEDCSAANLLFGGDKSCTYACLGLGSCVKACPFDAIKLSKEGLPVIDAEKCKLCGKCVEACPKGLLVFVPAQAEVYVGCSSKDKGGITRGICKTGCIGCMKCVKVCEAGAIEVKDNLARIDYTKCTSCGLCVAQCPTGTIKRVHSS